MNKIIEEIRNETDANIYIDRAIAMLKEKCEGEYLVAGYNGIVSLLQYAKQSHQFQQEQKQGAVWVRASERLPSYIGEYIIKEIGDKRFKNICHFDGAKFTDYDEYFEWLDETHIPDENDSEEPQRNLMDNYKNLFPEQGKGISDEQIYSSLGFKIFKAAYELGETHIPEKGSDEQLEQNRCTCYYFNKFERKANSTCPVHNAKHQQAEQTNPVSELSDEEIEKMAENIATECYKDHNTSKDIIRIIKAALQTSAGWSDDRLLGLVKHVFIEAQKGGGYTKEAGETLLQQYKQSQNKY